MSPNGLTRVVVAVLLLALAEGCRALPPVPEHARGATATDEGIPLDKLIPGLTYGPDEMDANVVPATAVVQEPTTSPSPSPAPSTRDVDMEDEDAGFQLSDLYPSQVYENVKQLTGHGPDENVARQYYTEGQQLYAEKKYHEAASQFASAATRWPDSTLEEDALFWAAESHFFADEYPKANDCYAKLLKKYQYSHYLDTVVKRLFAIGRFWEAVSRADPSWPITPNFFDQRRPLFDTWGNAVRAYDAVRLHDPTGPLADDAVMATANANFLNGRYDDASYHFDLLTKEYPQSEHQVPAHLLSMESKMAMYQGPMYDATVLYDAGEVADRLLTQYRDELGENRPVVVKTKNWITEEKAMRDWQVGQYYDKKKCYGAASVYYEDILKDYPQTAVAQRARARLQEIQGLPAEPQDHFKWLETVFPSHEANVGRPSSDRGLFDWIASPFHGSGRPSEEFRDSQTR